MSTSYQWSRRKGTTAQHAVFTGVQGEITIDTDKNTVVVHDGVTPGGFPLAKVSDVTARSDTIATLRASNLTPSTIYVTGYHTKGDGAFGSNIFRWNPTSTEDDNGGTIIKLDSVATGRYELQYDGAVNVKWFGAKGDGVTDDTAAIQNALNVCSLEGYNM